MEKIFIEHPWIIIVIVLWTLPWKAAALWRAARRGHLGWFLTIIILNTLGILDILYFFVFSGGGGGKVEKNEKPKHEENKSGEQFSHPKFSTGSKGRSVIM